MYERDPANKSFKRAIVIEDEKLNGLSIYRYPRGTLPVINFAEKNRIAMSASSIVSEVAGGGVDPLVEIGLSAYLLVDIFDPMMNRDSQVDLIQTLRGTEGIVLTHFGSSYERRHYFGPPEILIPYLKYDLSEYIVEKKFNDSKKDYGLVVQSAHFPYNLLPGLFANYPVNWVESKDGMGRPRYAESVYRLFKYGEDGIFDKNRPTDFPSDLSWPPVRLEESTKYSNQAEDLIRTSIRHHSFDPIWLKRKKHKVIINQELDQVVAVAGYQGSCTYNGHQILVATDSAVAPAYRRMNVAPALRNYMNRFESSEAFGKENQLIIVADFSDEAVAERYGRDKLGYEFARVPSNSRFSKSYWVGLTLKV